MSRSGRPPLAGGSAAATEHSSPGGSGGDPLESSASIGTGEDSEGSEYSSGGDRRMEIQRRQQDAALSTVAPVLPPPREVVFQPTNNHDKRDRSDLRVAELSTPKKKPKYVREIR